MLGQIKALPKEISDKIAAGEVVERPLSIVKELVENSVDAGSRSITVEIRKGGKEYIRVSDDGRGIEAEQTELAFKRYATSKIDTAEDLDHIHSLGFRGEALASIAAVSRVELTTKTKGSRVGSRIVVSGGITEERGDAACQEGTTIVVRDLFYNTPARRKFLKADNSESALITDFISKMAIAYPGIRVRLISNGSILFSTMGKGDLKQAILTVYSPQLVKKLLPVNYADEDYSIKAYISAPSESRTNRRYQIFFVNGRLVKSRIIDQAVSQAYSDKLFDGRYPCAFMFLKLPAETLDVNIHPTKTEIRFYEEEMLKDFIIKALRSALLNPEASELTEGDLKAQKADPEPQKPESPKETIRMPIPETRPVKPASVKLEPSDALKAIFQKAEPQKSAEKPPQPQPKKPFYKVSEEVMEVAAEGFEIAETGAAPIEEDLFRSLRQEREEKARIEALQQERAPLVPIPQIQSEPAEFTVQETIGPAYHTEKKDRLLFSELEYIGQFSDTYLICKSQQHLYFIDQHAAHERVLYEELIARFERGESDSQILMIPIILRMSPAEKEGYLDLLPQLKRLGYLIEDFGPGELAVKEVPSSMTPSAAEAFIENVFSKDNFRLDRGDLMRSEVIMSSCKAAVKGGDRLSHAEVKALFEQMDGCENPYNCPHGRPTYIRLSQYELEKLFKRK